MLPNVKLDQENFEEIMEEARGMISSIYPDWTDYNYSDPGITILELFAWLKEIQQFHMDQMSSSHEEKFLKLLMMKRREAEPASLLLQVDSAGPVSLQSGTRFYAGDVCFETAEAEELPGGSLKLCVSEPAGMEPSTQADENQLRYSGRLKFYPFGRNPAPGSCCEFCFSQPMAAGKAYRMSFLLFDQYEIRRNPVTGTLFAPLVRLRAEVFSADGWVGAEMLRDETQGLLQTGRMKLRPDSDMVRQKLHDTEGYWLRIVLEAGAYDVAPILTGISTGHIRLMQRMTISPGASWIADGFPNQEYEIGVSSILKESVEVQVEDVLNPGTYQTWKQVEDFESSSPEDQHYRIDTDRGMLVFGSGYHGMMPEGTVIMNRLSVTRGQEGNVKGEKITSCSALPADAKLVSFMDARGGRDKESIDDCFKRFRAGMKTPGRAVSAGDYERLIRQVPGLMIRSCRVLQSVGSQVSVVVRPFAVSGAAQLMESYRQNILHDLENRRLLGTSVKLLTPEYIEIQVYAEVQIKYQFLGGREQVEEEIRRFFKEREGEFGTPVLKGRLYGRIDSLDCVRELVNLNIEARGNRIIQSRGGDICLPPNGVLLLARAECVIVNG